MTPKEKTNELFTKYEFVYIPIYTSYFEVKQYAFIAVDEIFNNKEGLLMTEREIADKKKKYTAKNNIGNP